MLLSSVILIRYQKKGIKEEKGYDEYKNYVLKEECNAEVTLTI